MTLIGSNSGIIHPEVLEVLARVGHKGKILVTDALYSTATNVGPRCRVIHVALTVGAPTVSDVTTALKAAIALEELTRMKPESGETDLPVHQEIDRLLPSATVPHTWVGRQEFYDLARSDDVALCLSSGDTRRFANVLLTVGAPKV